MSPKQLKRQRRDTLGDVDSECKTEGDELDMGGPSEHRIPLGAVDELM